MLKKEPDGPEWKNKITHGRFQISEWEQNGQAPREINCFIRCKGKFTQDQQDQLAALGVTLTSIDPTDLSDSLNTGNIPYANLQQVCELDFVISIEFPKLHGMH